MTELDPALPTHPPTPCQVPFNLDSMVAHVEHILKTRGHAVVCMAEGAAKVRHWAAGPADQRGEVVRGGMHAVLPRAPAEAHCL